LRCYKVFFGFVEAKERGIHFEVCPTSSLETGSWNFERFAVSERIPWTAHPCIIMIDKGISVGINSDDPSVFGADLVSQYRLALSEMSLNFSSVVKLLLGSIDAAFTSDSDKAKLKGKLLSFLNNFDDR